MIGNDEQYEFKKVRAIRATSASTIRKWQDSGRAPMSRRSAPYWQGWAPRRWPGMSGVLARLLSSVPPVECGPKNQGDGLSEKPQSRRQPETSLAPRFSEWTAQRHPDLNGELTPHDVSPDLNQRVW